MGQDTAKKCSKCGIVKPLTEFHRGGKGKPRQSRCAPCERERNRLRSRGKPKTERKREAERQWQQRNREKMREYDRRWRENNRERARERYRRFCAKNKTWSRERSRRRRAERRNAPGHFTELQFQAKLAQWGYRCHWCGRKLRDEVHRDHLIALAQGGTNDISNIVPSCPPCNMTKAAHMPWEFNGRLL